MTFDTDLCAIILVRNIQVCLKGEQTLREQHGVSLENFSRENVKDEEVEDKIISQHCFFKDKFK
jgi:hypothetical protein